DRRRALGQRDPAAHHHGGAGRRRDGADRDGVPDGPDRRARRAAAGARAHPHPQARRRPELRPAAVVTGTGGTEVRATTRLLTTTVRTSCVARGPFRRMLLPTGSKLE